MFTTKRYTLNSLINEVSQLETARVTSRAALVNALSPVAGARSAKLVALNRFLGRGGLNQVLATGRGATLRTRLLNALRARQRTLG